MNKVKGEGPDNAEVVVVGEAPGEHEERHGRPFIGTSGQELTRMLSEAGFNREECFVTNVSKYRPPGNDITKLFLNKPKSKKLIPGPLIEEGINELVADIERIKPKLIIALGDTALWALTGKRGITKWRGSELNFGGIPLVPTYHPAAILRMWEWRFAGLCDLRRARRYLSDSPPVAPLRDYIVHPSFEQAMSFLAELRSAQRISCDIETRAKHIACVGFSSEIHRGLCIPLMCTENRDGYWSEEEEIEITRSICNLFQAPGIEWIFQNGLYDLQYFARYWGTVPSVYMDTMLAQHVCFLGDQPKSLDYLSSVYCEHHVYWKDDGKKWDPGMDERQLWRYNCEDADRTLEISYELDRLILALGREPQFREVMEQYRPVFRIMLRGVRCNRSLKGDMMMQLMEARTAREKWIRTAVGYSLLGPKGGISAKKTANFFYHELGFSPYRNRKTGNITTDDTALDKIAKKHIWISPLIEKIRELRSINVFLNTFVLMPLDVDQRIRCSFNIGGTETLRYSSSENAFDSGTNLQNLPTGDEASDLPNIRKLFIPDINYEIADLDLDRADAQVVAWEANDEYLKELFRSGVDIHLQNAKDIFRNERLTKDSRERQLAKTGVHAVNYGTSARTLAVALGVTTHQAEHFIRSWFAAHPGISDWHRRVELQLATTRSVSNKFGYVRHYFGRVEGLLPEALAWIPQSTVACVVRRALVRMQEYPEIQPLLQVHDSLVIQYLRWYRDSILPRAMECMRVEIPYDDPLTIPVSAKVSIISWGDCQKVA